MVVNINHADQVRPLSCVASNREEVSVDFIFTHTCIYIYVFYIESTDV